MKTNKTKEVLYHLQTYGTITSMEAIDMFGATRLAAIIFILRKRGYEIETLMQTTYDRYGNVCEYAKYVYRGRRDA